MWLDSVFNNAKYLFFLFLTLFGSSVLTAQNQTEVNWYFGNSVSGIIFDRSAMDANIITNQNENYGRGGSVVITDQLTSDLLFYSDGENIYDANHLPVPIQSPSEANLSGNPSANQSAAAVPVPGVEGSFYIFTNGSGFGSDAIEFSIVDRNEPGNSFIPQAPLGEVVSTNNTLGLNTPAEGMLIVPSDTGNNVNWLISQDRTTFEIKVMKIAPSVVPGDSIESFDLFNTEVPEYEVANFSYFQFQGDSVFGDSVFIAAAPKDRNRNISIFSFNPRTGDISLRNSILNTGRTEDAEYSIFDTEWSPDGRKIYLSYYGSDDPGISTAGIIQIGLTDSSLQQTPVVSDLFKSYGLKRGPDDLIYHLYQRNIGEEFFVGTIEADTALAFNYDSLAFDNNFNGRQFPEFTPPNFLRFDNVSFNYYAISECIQNVFSFFPNVTPTPQNIFWDFGDGEFSQDFSPVHEFASSGPVTVRMFVELNGVVQSADTLINIQDSQFMVDLGNDTTICPDEVLTLSADMGQVIVWNTGATSQSIQVDTAGTYWVAVRDQASGCVAFDEIMVTEYQSQVTKLNVWYFGERAGIDFNDGATPIEDNNVIFAPEGTSTVSDVNNEFLFYTNGDSVWHADTISGVHKSMPNGFDIGGDITASQNCIIPVPEDNTLFYIFSTREVYNDEERYELRYSLVDLKVDLPGRLGTELGDVVQKDQLLFANSTEKFTAVGIGSGQTWLVSREFGNNQIRAYPITSDGIGSPVFSAQGFVHSLTDEAFAEGNMAFSSDGRRMAVTIPGDSNLVEIFSFDSTGNLNDPILINIDEEPPNEIYGVQFSSDVRKLYVTTNGPSSKLIQYDLDSINAEDAKQDIEASKFDGYQGGTDYGALQTGPDGVIYMAQDNSDFVGSIFSPSGNDEEAGFQPEGLNINPDGSRNSRLGLPNFVQIINMPPQSPSIDAENLCQGDSVVLQGMGRDNSIEEYQWVVVDIASQDTVFESGPGFEVGLTTVGFGSDDIAGEFKVDMMLDNRCDTVVTFSDTFNISAPVFTTLDSEIPFCEDPIELTALDPGGVDNIDEFTFEWSTGETSNTITVNEPGFVDVSITNPDGCESENEIFIEPAVLDFDLGPSQFVCQGETLPDLDITEVSGTLNTWIINDESVLVESPNRTFSISTDSAGVFTYGVQVRDTLIDETCIRTDEVTITIQENPVIQLDSIIPACGGLGELQFSIDSEGSFNYNLTGPISLPNQLITGEIETVQNLQPGDYFLSVTNVVTGCISEEIFSIPSLMLEVDQEPVCEENPSVDLIANANPSANTTFQWFFTDTAENTIPLSDTTAIINVREPGNYIVEATDQNLMCSNAMEIEVIIIPIDDDTLTLDDQVTFCSQDPDSINRQVTLDAGPGFLTYDWRVGDNDSIIFQGREFTVNDPGIYSVDLFNGSVCITDQIIVNEDCFPVISAPNAFTPSTSPGLNDEWFIFPSSTVADEDFQVFIFNRWGELIFFSSDKNFRWNGTFNNEVVPIGTYPYLIRFRSIIEDGSGILEQRGGVAVIR